MFIKNVQPISTGRTVKITMAPIPYCQPLLRSLAVSLGLVSYPIPIHTKHKSVQRLKATDLR